MFNQGVFCFLSLVGAALSSSSGALQVEGKLAGALQLKIKISWDSPDQKPKLAGTIQVKSPRDPELPRSSKSLRSGNLQIEHFDLESSKSRERLLWKPPSRGLFQLEHDPGPTQIHPHVDHDPGHSHVPDRGLLQIEAWTRSMELLNFTNLKASILELHFLHNFQGFWHILLKI